MKEMGVVVLLLLLFLATTEGTAKSGLAVLRNFGTFGGISTLKTLQGNKLWGVYAESSGKVSFMWNMSANALMTTFAPAASGNPLSLDTIQTDTNVYRAIACYDTTGHAVWDFSYNVATNTFYQPIANSFYKPDQAPSSCVVDWSRNTVWMSRADKKIRRVTATNGTFAGAGDTAAYSTTFNYAMMSAKRQTAIFLMQNSKLVVVDLTTPSFTGIPWPEISTGVANLVCGAIDDTNDLVFIGTSIGIGLKMQYGQWSTFNLFYAGAVSLAYVMLDIPNRVSYWVDSNLRIYRVNYDDFNTVYDTTDTSCLANGCGGSAGGVIVDSQNMVAYFSFTNQLTQVQLVNCSVHTNCSDCMTDPNYCGWCFSTGTCVRKNVCPAQYFIQSPSVCPSLTSISPDSGSTVGGTSVTISGNYFYSGLNTTCRFNGVPGQYVSLNGAKTAITCTTPNSLVTGPVTVSVVYLNSLAYAENTLNFTYYNCSQSTSCDTCYSSTTPECGWCVETGVCTTAGSCTSGKTFLNTGVCPAITSITPGLGPDAGGTDVYLKISIGPNVATNLTCVFGSNSSSVLFVNSTIAYCKSPPSSSGSGFASLPVKIVYSGRSTVYASTTSNFIYYNCGATTNCDDCTVGSCKWCLAAAKCLNLNDNSCSSTTTTCPVLTGITPSSVFSYTQTTVTITGSLFLQNSTAFQCDFEGRRVNATVLSSSSLTCLNPVALSPNSHANVTLWMNNTKYSSYVLDFEYYDCNQTTCDTCLQHPGCNWCFQSQSCTNATCSDSINTCPSIVSTSPTQGTIDGGTSLLVTMSALPTGVNATWLCSFFYKGVTTNVNATVVSSTALQCVTPSNIEPGIAQLRILYNNRRYTPSSYSFTYYSCYSYSGDCNACLSIPGECSWCPPNQCVSALDTVTCSDSVQLYFCPYLDDVQPNNTESRSNNTVVTISGSFLSTAVGYTCNIGADIAYPISVSSNSISCVFPNEIAGTYQVGVGYNGQNFSLNTLGFDYHDCEGQTTCGSCLSASSYCGWCLSSLSCTAVDTCSPSLWSSICPSLTSVTPPESSTTGTTVDIIGVQFASELASNYTCLFGSLGSSPVTFISSTHLQCNAPATNVSTIVSLQLLLDDQPYTTNSLSFEFVDCNVYSTLDDQQCISCIINENPKCSWCVEERSCTLASSCNSSSLPVVNTINSCPFVTGITPIQGSTVGNETIRINGLSLFDRPELLCQFGNTTTPTVYVSSTELSCQTPAHEAGKFSFNLVFKNKAIPNEFTFDFVAPVPPGDTSASPVVVVSNAGTSSTIVIAVAVPVIAVILILAAIIIFMFIRRRKPKLKLVAPDFKTIAVGTLLPANFKLDKQQFADYTTLETILLGTNGVVESIIDVTSPTEADKLSKALTIIFSSKGSGVDLLRRLLTREINISTGEGTLFRNDSVASKVFSQYVKICGGIPYLWKTLAYPVNELAMLAQDKGKDKDERASKEVRLMNFESLEVDPSKLEGSEQDLTINQLQFLLIAQKLFKAIMDSSADVPNDIRNLLAFLKEKVGEKYPDAVYKSLGGQFFLRFLCPSITAPHVYGLMPQPPGTGAQRFLVLLSKVLQNLANNTLPGKKEEYMEKMNDFITTNQDALKQFYEKLVKEVNDQPTQPVDLPKNYRENALAFMHLHINNSLKKLTPQMDTTVESDTRKQLTDLLDKLGNPAEVVKP